MYLIYSANVNSEQHRFNKRLCSDKGGYYTFDVYIDNKHPQAVDL